MKKILLLCCVAFLLSSCTSIVNGYKDLFNEQGSLYVPTSKAENIIPVDNVDVDDYLGKWYEIARLENDKEKGMTDSYIKYSRESYDSMIIVFSGIKLGSDERTYFYGDARFAERPDLAYLQVSFNKPFYGPHVMFKLDGDRNYAYVSGETENHLWLLSRTKTVPDNIRSDFIARAKHLGFNTKKLVWVKQN